ncbi:MAG: tetratricopeptide repeat protein [Sterolibacterium sp.]|nr:tetratricopeptide repeat protein [Sterolibacterium sp.]
MAVYDHEEQEQLDELKVWWKQYGNLVTGVLLVVALAMAGWQGWNWWQREQSLQASALYTLVERAVEAHDAKRVREAAGELIDKHGRTRYALMAAMLSARIQLETGDIKSAKTQLEWAQQHAAGSDLHDLVNLRLAEVMLEEKSYDAALQALTAAPAAAFAPRYAEVRGDILAAQGKLVEAGKAYQQALDKIDESQKSMDQPQQQTAYRDMLQIKLESLALAGDKQS